MSHSPNPQSKSAESARQSIPHSPRRSALRESRRSGQRKRHVRKAATPPKFRKRTRASSSYSPSSGEDYSDDDDFPSYRSDWKKKTPISTREIKNRIADIQNILEEAQLKLKVLLSD